MVALGLVLIAGLLTAALLLGALLTILWWFDRCDDEPVSALVLAGAWGVTGAAAVGLGLERWQTASQAWQPGGDLGGLTVGLASVAQILLATGVALLARRVDGPTDGMLVGCSAGLGWAVCEAAAFGPARFPGGTEGSTPPLPTLLLLVAAGVGASAVASGSFGGLFGMARLARGFGARILWVVGGLTLAILFDAGWRWSRGTVTGAGGGWPAGLLLLGLVIGLGALLLWSLLRAEGRVLAEELQEELAWRVVPAWVVATIPSYRSRVRGDWWPERRTRVVIARLLSRLALRKRAVRGLPAGAAGLAALEVGKLRSRSRALLSPESPGEE